MSQVAMLALTPVHARLITLQSAARPPAIPAAALAAQWLRLQAQFPRPPGLPEAALAAQRVRLQVQFLRPPGVPAAAPAARLERLQAEAVQSAAWPLAMLAVLLAGRRERRAQALDLAVERLLEVVPQ